MNNYQIDPRTGLLSPLRLSLSPHADERPFEEVSLLVIHNISLPPKQFGGPHIEDLFLGKLDYTAHPSLADLKGLKVSSHFVIDRLGIVTQYVSVFERAWHAGKSQWQGRDSCNEFSIGIELEGADDVPFEEIQYEKLVKLAKCLMKYFPLITKERVVGHSDIAPGRKTDPGAMFEWERFRGDLWNS
jgi:AmpD protein